MARTVLEVRDLWVGEGAGAPCRGVSLLARAGEVLCVLGPTGAGKSQLLRCIGLDFPPSAGSVLVCGDDVTRGGSDRRRQLRARSIELVHPPVPDAAGGPGVSRPSGRLWMAARARRTVPGPGMRQRIQIAKALTHSADLLLLDEPLAGVEPQVQTRILELLERVKAGRFTAIVVATRDSRTAALLADTVLVMDEGEVIEAGPAGRVLEDPQHPRTRELVAKRMSA